MAIFNQNDRINKRPFEVIWNNPKKIKKTKKTPQKNFVSDLQKGKTLYIKLL